jgi:hypothetical protein
MAIVILNVVVGLADPVEFVSVAMVMRAIFLADEEDGGVTPGLSEKP